MKITCGIVEDLLPLYIDDICSPDSKAALEEHLNGCPSCREKLNRMQKDDFGWKDQVDANEIQLVNYAKKIRNHRIRVAILSIITTLALAALLSLLLLTIRDIHYQMNPIIPIIEEGTFNLVADSLEIPVEDLEQYIFYTNYSQISVSVKISGDLEGCVMLYDAADNENCLLTYDVNSRNTKCLFTNLSAARRYTIKCTGIEGTTITVSEGRTPDFLKSLRNVLVDLLNG